MYREEEGNRHALLHNQSNPSRRCFRFDGEGSTPKAELWISIQDKHAEVANIVPLQPGVLSHEEYNDLIARFSVAVRRAVAANRRAKLCESSAHQDVEDWLPPQAATAFREFAANANPSTGGAHPRDQERWHQFITLAHVHEATVRPDLLGRWLQENAQWAEDAANGLVIEYEKGRRLLQTRDTTVGK